MNNNMIEIIEQGNKTILKGYGYNVCFTMFINRITQKECENFEIQSIENRLVELKYIPNLKEFALHIPSGTIIREDLLEIFKEEIERTESFIKAGNEYCKKR